MEAVDRGMDHLPPRDRDRPAGLAAISARKDPHVPQVRQKRLLAEAQRGGEDELHAGLRQFLQPRDAAVRKHAVRGEITA